MSREYHVAKWGADGQEGSAEKPFLTINRAAAVAMPGDTVIVHEGVYREWVDPKEGGTSDICRITYQAAEGEKVVIKGSERIQSWEQQEGEVWKAVLPNTFFGDFNPYAEYLEGDWLIDPGNYMLHLGDVYLNGKSFYEARSLEEVRNPKERFEGYNPPRRKRKEYIPHPEDTTYQWFACVDETNTIIYANFHGVDPNKEVTEINVRKCCFYPSRIGRNYITVCGFEIAQAACPWAPPTSNQVGMIGPHWSKGWIIERNRIHDAKCSAVSLGKEESTGHNLFTRTRRKPGYTYQMESVCRALQIGWSKETVGSHIVRNNYIYNCGQNGIVGHLGCIFSQIYDNEIFNIAVKHEFFGHEIAGIKLHAAIDVQIVHNNIHDCTLGIWLDWQAQGTRVSRSLFYRNDRDLMVEVTHGPHLLDNNIFASAYNFDNMAQGGAYVHNICCGIMHRDVILDRSTPYHFPHTTQMLGTAFVYSGDDRFFENIFVGGQKTYSEKDSSGTNGYDGSPESIEEYVERIDAANVDGTHDHDLYFNVKQPVMIRGNAYFNRAQAYERETECYQNDMDPQVKVLEEQDGTYLELIVDKAILERKRPVIRTCDLGTTRLTEAAYENPDGTPIHFDIDFNGQHRTEQTVAGPFANLHAGKNRIKVWG